MTTSRALIADGRRAPRGRVEKSVTAMDGQRTAGAGSCLTQRARPAPITSRNRTKQEQERRINRKRGTACRRTLFPQDRAWPCCTHNPKVAGSNPARATVFGSARNRWGPRRLTSAGSSFISFGLVSKYQLV